MDLFFCPGKWPILLNRTKTVRFLIVAFTFLSVAHLPIASGQKVEQPFTVADEIGLAHFGDPYGWRAEAVRFSPDGNYFAVDTERGRLDLNKVEDSLRFYRSQDVKHFLEHSTESLPPTAIWMVHDSDREGPIICDWRWLADSNGVAFLERKVGSKERLMVADLRKRTVEPLTSGKEEVKAFDIRDRHNYVYTVTDMVKREEMQAEHKASAIAGTGRSLFELLLPDDPVRVRMSSAPSYLWAVVGGKRFEVKRGGAPIVPDGRLALSPDSRSLVTTLLVLDIPPSWETLYPAPFASSLVRIHVAGGSVHQYVRIDLQTGSVQALTDAATSNDAGWWTLGSPSWSSSGQEILLPGTFLKSKENAPSRPCVAVVDLPFTTRTCVEILKGHTENGVEEGYHLVTDVRFANGDDQRVMVSFRNHEDSYSHGTRTTEYRRTTNGAWQVTKQVDGVPEIGRDGLEVTVKQGFNEPPMLVATDRQTSRVIWDPNPQFNNVELGQAIVYTWKDEKGRDWRGGLYKPDNYRPGQRYPLVIQTHGFTESAFEPSGFFPTAFAARALAAVGIVVLQVQDLGCITATIEEGLCAVSGYEAAANQLVSKGLVDPEKIGIIGFSRTCFYVMETLTTSSLHLKAASITDGVMEDYLQYIISPERFSIEANAMIGAPPFGEGLQQLLKRSPGFNLNKVAAPLLVVAGEGSLGLLSMWEPYAGLHYLHKPVDLIVLNSDEHVLTNPAVRMASQGGSVDWFRFWLQDYDDPDPAKAEQYARWRDLRKLQEAQERTSTTPQATSN